MPISYRLAIHEGGHAVMFRACGASVPAIVFTEQLNRTLGSCWRDQNAILSKRQDAMCDYAGFAAERRVDPSRPFCGTDKQWFDEDTAGMDAQAVQRLKDEVDTTLDAQWSEVEKLATEIVRKDGLYRDDLRALGYWSPPDTALRRALS